MLVSASHSRWIMMKQFRTWTGIEPRIIVTIWYLMPRTGDHFDHFAMACWQQVMIGSESKSHAVSRVFHVGSASLASGYCCALSGLGAWALRAHIVRCARLSSLQLLWLGWRLFSIGSSTYYSLLGYRICRSKIKQDSRHSSPKVPKKLKDSSRSSH